jgi:hypothetical protein
VQRYAARLDVAAQVEVVVDLAVVGDDVAAGRRRHRLLAERRQVEDGEPPVPQRDPRGAVHVDRGVVGAAVLERGGHAADEEIEVEAAVGIEQPGNSTHE